MKSALVVKAETSVVHKMVDSKNRTWLLAINMPEHNAATTGGYLTLIVGHDRVTREVRGIDACSLLAFANLEWMVDEHYSEMLAEMAKERAA